ncbi:hypothetical protein LPJ53_005248 [Coemansia erecta]|uniref:Phox-like protein n=1 Tax=Coemansia erecta TaxID=147472 RepID=A0A9W7XX51_9FUNG|nr:hypothetical protein LPJ53_005248 [Coemansia erecta]
MEEIRYVKIPLAETRTEPDTHVEYALNVQGPVRSWTVWHRYNDFLTLHYELTREFPGVNLPVELPPKSLTSWFSKITTATSGMSGGSGSNSSTEFIEERRHALERYIQSMVVNEDGRWRTSTALQRFLAPTTKGSKYLAGAKGHGSGNGKGSDAGSLDSEVGWVTPASWLNDQRDAEQIIRDVRQSILRRENALTRNEVSVSHQSLLQAKRHLTELGKAIRALEQSLEQIKGALTNGELLRRQDMLMRLGDERANLTRIVLGTGVTSGGSERAALLNGASPENNGDARVLGRVGNGSSYSLPGAMPMRALASNGAQQAGAPPSSRSRRVFGNSNPPQETNETRGLDSQGLLMLQNERMRDQDKVASDLTALLRRQREMGVAIGDELDLQNQMLTDLDQNLDRTGSKLAAARRHANQFT